MKFKKLICAALLMALMMCACGARAAALQKAWMTYEDYSDNGAEQVIEDPALLKELEEILLRARDNPAELDGCTLNATLFCMADDGNIYDFACATDGCPFIQSRANSKVYTLGLDFQRFWEIFSEILQGMGYDASAVFDW